MKKVLSLVLLLLSLTVGAQNVNCISIASVVPENSTDMDASTLNLLKARMEAITSNNGVSTMQNGTFVMYPVFNIIKSELMEGGMRNVYSIEAELSLFISQQSTNTQFGHFSFSLKGAGYNKQAAVKNAISKINVSDARLSAWFDTTKQKIENYFSSNLQQMLSSAYSLSSAGRYDEALALLSTYPNSLSGYDKIVDAQLDIYGICARKQCSLLILQANGAIALQKYDEAIQILSDIDNASPCYDEAMRLSNQIGEQIKAEQKAEEDAKIAAEERDRAERMERERADREMTERQNIRDYNLDYARLRTVGKIAEAYYNSQPRVIYNFY